MCIIRLTGCKKRINPPLLLPAIACVSGSAAGVQFFTCQSAFVFSFLIVFFFFLFFIRKKTRDSFIWFLSALLFLVCANSVSGIVDETGSENFVRNCTNKQKLLIFGEVAEKPESQARRKKIVIRDVSIKEKGQSRKDVDGKLCVYVYNIKKPVQYGDRLTIKSKIRRPRNFGNPGGFDYKRYLAFKGIRGIVYTDADFVDIRDTRNDFSFYDGLLRKINTQRESFADFISDSVENTGSASVLTLLTTGLTAKVSEGLRLSFSKAGASHILAISGLHLSIVAGIFFFLFNSVFKLFKTLLVQGLNRKIAAFATLIPLTYYALLSGFSPSTQRAYIMIVVFLLSYAVEKQADGINSLCAAAVLILLIDPAALFSVSFQLSFTAVLFIILGLSLVKDCRIVRKNDFTSRVFIFFCVSFFAVAGTIPIVMYYFNLISFVQLFTNFIMIPTLGFICVPLGITAFFVFPFFPDLSVLLTALCEPILLFSVKFAEFTAAQEFTWARCVTPHQVDLFCYYLSAAVLFLVLKKRNTRYFFVLIPLLAVFVAFHAVGLKKRYFNENLTVTVLDVGQGNSFLIEAPRGVRILVDGGGFPYTSGFDTGKYIVAPFLWQKNILALDAVILTHPEMDHMNGLIYLLKNFKVDMFVKNNDKRDKQSFKDMMKTLEKKETRVCNPPFRGGSVDVQGVELRFLNPANREGEIFHQKLNYNDRSLVFKLSGETVSILFPGDITRKVEKQMVELYRKKLESEILVAPHHGSSSSSSASFLDRVNPDDVIISCGWKNRYGFPAKEVIKRCRKIGADVYRTDLQGAVEIYATQKDYEITPMKGE